jgi:hypothetical protein
MITLENQPFPKRGNPIGHSCIKGIDFSMGIA